ncbi:MAG: peptide chain release factor N(5)-glutamine methyltransferase [Hydrogenibacillus schlegelii]|nr:peptide chain release factor N(5)-glutamine methyltransferase [Hydrogenibacillus schlegelii]
MRDQLSVAEAYRIARARLAGRPDLDADQVAAWLLRHLLGLDGTAFARQFVDPAPAVPRAAFFRLLRRLARGEPFAYVVGTAPFAGEELAVGPGVLVPRPETEGLVELVAAEPACAEPRTALDLGTGSGAIAVLLARRCPTWTVTGIDQSPVAVLYARENARRLGVRRRVRIALASIEAYVPPAPADVLVANPPYVPEGAAVSPAARFEPPGALFAGPDGLAFYRLIAARLAAFVRPGGLVALEIGAGQAAAALALLRAAGVRELSVRPDFRGLDRYVFGRAP